MYHPLCRGLFDLGTYHSWWTLNTCFLLLQCSCLVRILCLKVEKEPIKHRTVTNRITLKKLCLTWNNRFNWMSLESWKMRRFRRWIPVLSPSRVQPLPLAVTLKGPGPWCPTAPWDVRGWLCLLVGGGFSGLVRCLPHGPTKNPPSLEGVGYVCYSDHFFKIKRVVRELVYIESIPIVIPLIFA